MQTKSRVFLPTQIFSFCLSLLGYLQFTYYLIFSLLKTIWHSGAKKEVWWDCQQGKKRPFFGQLIVKSTINMYLLVFRTVVWRAFSQSIIFLYLMDENTSLLVFLEHEKYLRKV